ncbi:MAG: hypothetical protein NDJ89_11215 [Oligoflexia bacterium]|nr:hypothetical protein [Oligoflexia bacterium]
MKRALLSAALAGIIALAPSPAATLAAPPEKSAAREESTLEDRIKDLERQTEELIGQSSERMGQVRPFLRDAISLGGFFENAILALWGPDTRGQVSATSQILGINLAADIHESLRFSTQLITGLSFPLQNAGNNPNAPAAGLPESRRFGPPVFGALPAQGYTEYDFSPSARFQTGFGYVPFGIAFQKRELVLFKRRNGPQMIFSSGGDGVTTAYPLWSGLHLHGELGTERRWSYHAYSLTPISNPKTLGGGARVQMIPSDELAVGISSQVAKRAGDTYKAIGGDLAFKLGRFGMDSEVVFNVSGGEDPWAFYIEPSYVLSKGNFILWSAVDYLSNPLGQTTGARGILPDPIAKWEYGAGINWLPHSYTRFRLGLLFHDYTGDSATIEGRDRDYVSLDLSAGVAF